MEQTLGKRIAYHRKRKGLTQDMLAEKLGITAQAVSKWENDQSCPDITTLPKLAEIFGISIDELLGCQPVHEAEVVEEEKKEYEHGIHFGSGGKANWEFHWDAGKHSAVWFALMVLWIGGLTFVARLLDWDTSFWSIAWPSALLFCGFHKFAKGFSVGRVCLVAIGAGFLLNNLHIWDIDIAGKYIFPALILLFGLGLLIDAMKKPKKPRFSVSRDGVKLNGTDTQRCHCTSSDGQFECDIAFKEYTHRLETDCFTGGTANVSFAELTVDLQDCARVAENCQVEVNCSFGEVTLLVPGKFRVDCEPSTCFGNISVKGHPNDVPEGVIHLEANVSFGETVIRYV